MPTTAIHIVFTTYGTWLPGDDRGHWSPLFNLYGHLLRAGHRLNMSDEITADVARHRMIEPPKTLTAPERDRVAAEFSNHFRYDGLPQENHRYTVASIDPGQARGYMKPICHAAAIEENHVHMLAGVVEEDLERYVGRLKGRSSSVLKGLPQNASRKHHWTAKFWRVFLYDHEALLAVREYIINHNLRNALPADPYPFITRPI
jgi:hypothetical protein